MILSKSLFSLNSKISDIRPQIIDFKNLDDSVVIFQALQTSAASLTSGASAASPHWPQMTLQPYFLKKHLGTDLIITGTKMTHTGHFLLNESSKIQFFSAI